MWIIIVRSCNRQIFNSKFECRTMKDKFWKWNLARIKLPPFLSRGIFKRCQWACVRTSGEISIWNCMLDVSNGCIVVVQMCIVLRSVYHNPLIPTCGRSTLICQTLEFTAHNSADIRYCSIQRLRFRWYHNESFVFRPFLLDWSARVWCLRCGNVSILFIQRDCLPSKMFRSLENNRNLWTQP